MCLGKPRVPDPPEVVQRQGYQQPAPKSSVGSDDASRRRLMGVVNTGGAQGISEPASTTKNLVLGGGTTGLQLNAGGAGGAPPGPVANAAAPSNPISPLAPAAPAFRVNNRSGGGGAGAARNIALGRLSYHK